MDSERTPRRSRSPIRVEVVRSAEVMDFEAWARGYVREVLRAEGYEVPHDDGPPATPER